MKYPYEEAAQLKELGFPQIRNGNGYYITESGTVAKNPDQFPEGWPVAYYPTTEEVANALPHECEFEINMTTIDGVDPFAWSASLFVRTLSHRFSCIGTNLRDVIVDVWVAYTEFVHSTRIDKKT